MYWKSEYNGTVPLDYLRDNQDKTSTQIARALSELTGETISKSAVKKARKRYSIKFVADEVVAKEQDNYLDASLESDSPITLQDLITKFNIDTNIFELVIVNPGQWGVAHKDEEKRLIYEEGKIQEGEIIKRGMKTHTLYKLSATFRKRILEPIELTIQPVNSTITYNPPMPVYKIFKKALIFTDPHVGYIIDYATGKLKPLHNRAVLNLILEICRLIQPDSIHITGDWFDLAEQSDKFLSTPQFRNTFQPAIEESYIYLRWLREACPQSKIYLHKGNHEERINRAILKNMQWAYGIRAADEIDLPPQLSIPRLLALHNLQIEYIDNYPNDISMVGNTELCHSSLSRKNSGGTVSALIRDATISKIVGHNHRIESATKTIWEGFNQRFIQVVSAGCTCHLDGRVPGVNARQNWQNGFAILNYTDDHTQIDSYPVINDEVFFEGNLLQAKSYVDQLRKSNTRWNW